MSKKHVEIPADFLEQFEEAEAKREGLINTALAVRQRAVDIDKQIEALKKKKAEEEKKSQAAQRALDTHYKCLVAGCILGALKSKTTDQAVKDTIVEILKVGVKKAGDKKELAKLYEGLSALVESTPATVSKPVQDQPKPSLSIAQRAAAMSPPGTGTVKPTDLQSGKERLFGKKPEPGPVTVEPEPVQDQAQLMAISGAETEPCPKCGKILPVKIYPKSGEHFGKKYIKCDVEGGCGQLFFDDGES